jgi:GT2 family glycosyltransferase
MQTEKFSILIPTWNNFPYLKLCIESIWKYSDYKHQILVYVNEGTEEVIDWLNKNQIEFKQSSVNMGICSALNELAALVKTPYIVYMNDDMVALPHWDTAFMTKIKKMPDNLFYLSSTLIEPHQSSTQNSPFIIADYGDDLEHFREKELVADMDKFKRSNWSGASWPVSLVSADVWNRIGGYSIEFSPGMYSDPDFSMKLWFIGVRNFIGIGDCLFYHFGSKTTKKVKQKHGSLRFLNKWGISANTFYTHYLQMSQPWRGRLSEPHLSFTEIWRNNFKKSFSAFRR